MEDYDLILSRLVRKLQTKISEACEIINDCEVRLVNRQLVNVHSLVHYILCYNLLLGLIRDCLLYVVSKHTTKQSFSSLAYYIKRQMKKLDRDKPLWIRWEHNSSQLFLLDCLALVMPFVNRCVYMIERTVVVEDQTNLVTSLRFVYQGIEKMEDHLTGIT